jgi:NAD(P)-dependent dehydrogenase (short-subunit alcohol dehydrogenase family)
MPTKIRLSAKRALVTGGSRGIGAASSLALAQLGCDISISYRHDAQAASAVTSGCARLRTWLRCIGSAWPWCRA